MAEKPPGYDSVPLYDIEEHATYDYDGESEDGALTEDDIKFREEMAYIANLPPDFEPHEHRRILCFVLAFVTVLSFTLSLFLFHHDPSVSHSTRSSPSAPRSTQLLTFDPPFTIVRPTQRTQSH